jgi:hypothetical protein
MGRSVWIQAALYVLLGGGFWVSYCDFLLPFGLDLVVSFSQFCGFLGVIHSSELRQTRLPRGLKFVFEEKLIADRCFR